MGLSLCGTEQRLSNNVMLFFSSSSVVEKKAVKRNQGSQTQFMLWRNRIDFISIIAMLNFTGFVLSEVPQTFTLDTAWNEVCVSSKAFLTCTFLLVI